MFRKKSRRRSSERKSIRIPTQRQLKKQQKWINDIVHDVDAYPGRVYYMPIDKDKNLTWKLGELEKAHHIGRINLLEYEDEKHKPFIQIMIEKTRLGGGRKSRRRRTIK